MKRISIWIGQNVLHLKIYPSHVRFDCFVDNSVLATEHQCHSETRGTTLLDFTFFGHLLFRGYVNKMGKLKKKSPRKNHMVAYLPQKPCILAVVWKCIDLCKQTDRQAQTNHRDAGCPTTMWCFAHSMAWMRSSSRRASKIDSTKPHFNVLQWSEKTRTRAKRQCAAKAVLRKRIEKNDQVVEPSVR